MVGLFINTIPLRMKSNPDEKIKSLILKQDHLLQKREEFANTPLPDIIEYSGLGGSESLFDTIMVMENYPLDNSLIPQGSSLKLNSYSICETTHYDLTIAVLPFDEIELKFLFNTNSFKPERIRNLSLHFKNILTFMIENSEKTISQLEMVSDKEKNCLLYEFNRSETTFRGDKTIHGLFLEQVEKTLDQIALSGSMYGKSHVDLTYRQLENISRNVAIYLKKRGLEPKGTVAIMVDRHVEMIFAIIGVLRADAAYVPLDPKAPGDRLNYVLGDCNAKLVLSFRHLTPSLPTGIEKLYLEEFDFNHSDMNSTPIADSLNGSCPDNLAYIIYTSGSTGKPKGVPICHCSFSPLMHWGYRQLAIDSTDCVIQNLSYYFDWSVWEIFITLTSGAHLHMVNEEKAIDPSGIVDYIREFKITVLHITPTQLSYLVNTNQAVPGLRYLFIGAEKLTFDLVARTLPQLSSNCRIFNMYGPTEATIISSVIEILPEKGDYYRELGSVPIGRRVANSSLLVLDKGLKLCPIDVDGELYIAGDALTAGYLNDPEKTAGAFIPNPFDNSGKSRLYKTGDMTRCLEDGSILFLGRTDSQVKIRGLRIELGEIENRLNQYRQIKDALVMVREDNGNEKYICAYIVPNGDINTEELREFLGGGLPSYMIPSHFVILEKMPLNPNGKVDRKSLPNPDFSTGAEYQAPRNTIEIKLEEIWKNILYGETSAGNLPDSSQKKIGLNDNFFQLGGHSLKITTLASRIHKTFNVKIPLTDIFKKPTIRLLSNYIANTVEERHSSLAVAEKKEYYPLSSAQKRLYFLQQLDQEGTTYNIYNAWILNGDLNKIHLEQAFEQIIRRHESFRTAFDVIDEIPVQRIFSDVPFSILFNDLSGERIGENNKNFDFSINEIFKRFIRPFNLFNAPLMRVGLVKLAEKKHLLLVDIHHIISDGMSVEIMAREFSSLLSGHELPPIRFQYRDYAEWQHQEKDSNEQKKQENFWLNEFAGDIPVLELPTDFKRPALQSFNGKCICFELDEETTAFIKRTASATSTTPYMLLLALYNIFLTKITGQDDLVIGTPLAGRRHGDLENIMGMFVNTLPLRNFPAKEKKFPDFLMEIKERTLRAFENQEYQYEDLVEKVVRNRETSRNPLFDTVLALQNTGNGDMKIPGLQIISCPPENKTAKFDLSLLAVETEEKFLLTFEYSTALFKKETIEEFISYFKNLSKTLAKNHIQTIREISILSPEQRKELLVGMNIPEKAFPTGDTIHGLFIEQVKRTPDKIALTGIKYGEGLTEWTYSQLEGATRRLAKHLSSIGIGPGIIAAIMVDRSVDMILAILAVLRTGAAYLPLDPQIPINRLKFVLADSNSNILLTFRHFEKKLNESNIPVDIFYLDLFSYTQTEPSSLPAVDEWGDIDPTSSQNIAYIIYTSGSTGKPKGVPISHRNFSPLVHWGYSHLGIKPSDKVIQNLSYYFDWSVWEIFITLTSGASLHMITEEILLNPIAMVNFIHEHSITILHITPTQFGYLVNTDQSMGSLRYLCIGAEKLNYELVARSIPLISAECKIYNMYGPTEATIISASADVQRELGNLYNELQAVPIGMTVGNTVLLVLDAALNPCPVNISGELYIAGDAVSSGYLNDPEKTLKSFIKNPFNEVPGSVLYKTGDLVRRLKDGSILFIDRVDFQVKIRGYRIELGEIENALLQYAGIKDALVLVKETNQKEKLICAYIVFPGDINLDEIRKFLSQRLPAYMMPSAFVKLDQFPLNPNGKVDRKALPEPVLISGVEYREPRNETDLKLLNIWNELLFGNIDGENNSSKDRGRIGIDDNFFHVGGHSLKTTILATRIHKAFDVKITLAEIFKRATIRGLSDYINDATRERYTRIDRVEEKEFHELSSAQMRLHFLQQLDKEGTAYNINSCWLLEGNIDKNHIEQAIQKLIRRHESFRTYFEIFDEKPVQRIAPVVPFGIEYYEGPPEEVITRFIRPFDLTRAPLLRVGLLKLNQERHLLLLDMHHIISDGTSTVILSREFSSLLAGQELPQLLCSYKDYAAWQAVGKNSELLKKQENFWCNEFSGEIPLLNLPTDFGRPSIQDFSGDEIHFELNPIFTHKLREFALNEEATLYMVLLALYNTFLFKISGQEDIVVGTPVAGRRHADLEGIIGLFVNTLALRNYPTEEKRFSHFLSKVKERTLNAFDNQDYQYEDLVEKIVTKREASRNPLFDTLFVLQNTGSGSFEIPGLNLTPYDRENKTSKFDISLTVTETTETLKLAFEYSTRLFEPETIHRFITYFKNTVFCILEDKEKKISEIQIISEEEKKRILFDFNATDRIYPQYKNISLLIREQAEKTPDRIALASSSQQYITYNELDKRAGNLAHLLQQKGAGPNTIVGLMVERSIEMIVGLLGILKSGSAYLPVDPDYPPDRVRYMLDDSGSPLLITRLNFTGNLEFNREIIDIEAIEPVIKYDNSNAIDDRRDLIYMIYTSGSTGKPKGVMIEKEGFLNMLYWFIDALSIREEDNNLLISPVSFDLSQKNIFTPFLTGSRLTLSSPGIPDYIELTGLIPRERVSVICCAPSVFYPLLDSPEDKGFSQLKSLRAVAFGGEPIRVEKLLPWINTPGFSCNLFNTYGPTECTDIASYYPIPHDLLQKQTNIPIGKTIPNVNLYILDKYLQVLPLKIPGELCIGGIGLSRGYHNNETLTNTKFVDTPHLPVKKVYRSGDLTCWLPDGNIEFLGRIDHQVKIRGLRIELGEIENELIKHQEIKEAIVIARKNKTGENYLCAYIVPHPAEVPSVTVLKEFLGRNLPPYMIPSFFVVLDTIPLTPSGKLNRNGLPEPEINEEMSFTAPRDRLEEELVKIWNGVLEINTADLSIGIDDNFFQLGGHSLKATLLVSRIHKILNVKIPLGEIFKNPTIRGIAGYIRRDRGEKYIAIEPFEEKEYYSLSSAQRRFYFLQQMEPGSTAYNNNSVMILEGNFDKERFADALNKMVHRHGSLRTSFCLINGEPVQRIHELIKLEIEYSDYTAINSKQYAGLSKLEAHNISIPEIIHNFDRPFDLTRAPLLKVSIIPIDRNKSILLLCMHHIISDGTSMVTFMNELIEFYMRRELPPLKLQYTDFSQWQRQLIESGKLKQQEEYWINRFSGSLPVLDLPTDFPRPHIKSYEGNRIHFLLEKTISDRMEDLIKKTGVTLYMFLFALYSILLSKLSGQKDIIIGSPIAGRHHSDLEHMIGLLIEVMVIRSFPEDNKTFEEFLYEVKTETLAAYENQEYPFGELLTQLNNQWDESRNPVFDAMLIVQNMNMDVKVMLLEDLKIGTYEEENHHISKVDLTLEAVEIEKGIQCSLEYCTKLFSEETMNAFISAFNRILSIVLENPSIKLDNISLSEEPEFLSSSVYDEVESQFEF